MKELPKGWAWRTMADVAEVKSGSTPKTTEPTYWGGEIPWITPKDLASHNEKLIERGARNITEKGLASCSAQLLPPGTVVFSTRAPIGYVAIAANPVATNQGFKNFVPGADVSSDYLYWYLRSAKELAESLSSGTTFRELSGRAAAKMPIPVPPRKVQDAIVGELEMHFSRLQSAEAASHRARLNLRRYVGAVHQAAISGRMQPPELEAEPASVLLASLGIDSRDAAADLPANWVDVRLGDLVRVGSGATPKKDRVDYYEGGTVPWVTSGALNAEFVAEPTGYITEKALHETAVKLWPPHTLLVAMYGEGRTRGKCSELLFESTTNQACAALVFSEATLLLQPWVKMFLTATYEVNRRRASGGVQPNLSLGLVKDLRVPIPPFGEQDMILKELRRHVSVGSTAVRDLALTEQHGRALARKILSDAFHGRLSHGAQAA